MIARAAIALAVVVSVVAGRWLIVPAGAQTPSPSSCAVAIDSGTTYSGTGHEVLDIGRLDAGVYVVQIMHQSNGGHTFIDLTGRDTVSRHNLVPWSRDPLIDISTVLRISEDEADDYLMEVDADGEWEITIDRA